MRYSLMSMVGERRFGGKLDGVGGGWIREEKKKCAMRGMRGKGMERSFCDQKKKKKSVTRSANKEDIGPKKLWAWSEHQKKKIQVLAVHLLYVRVGTCHDMHSQNSELWPLETDPCKIHTMEQLCRQDPPQALPLSREPERQPSTFNSRSRLCPGSVLNAHRNWAAHQTLSVSCLSLPLSFTLNLSISLCWLTQPPSSPS